MCVVYKVVYFVCDAIVMLYGLLAWPVYVYVCVGLHEFACNASESLSDIVWCACFVCWFRLCVCYTVLRLCVCLIVVSCCLFCCVPCLCVCWFMCVCVVCL